MEQISQKAYLTELQKIFVYASPSLHMDNYRLQKTVEKTKQVYGNLTAEFLEVTNKHINNPNFNFLVYCDAWINESIVQPLLKSMPENISSILKTVPVGTLPTMVPNAAAIKCPNGKPVVALDYGLIFLVFHYNELLYKAVTSHMASQEAFTRYFAPKCKFVMEYYNNRNKLLKGITESEMINLIDLSISEEDSNKIWSVAFLHLLFIVAHEFAHIYAGHLNETKYLNIVHNNKEENIEFYTKSQQNEFVADKIAKNWLLNCLNSDTPLSRLINKTNEPDDKFTFIGVMSFLHLFDLSNSTHKDNDVLSHPKAISRLETLVYDDPESLTENELVYAVFIYRLINSILVSENVLS